MSEWYRRLLSITANKTFIKKRRSRKMKRNLLTGGAEINDGLVRLKKFVVEVFKSHGVLVGGWC